MNVVKNVTKPVTQTLIVQFLSNSYLFAAEGNQMSGLSAFDQLSSVHKENIN
jgi:hypothetical protein